MIFREQRKSFRVLSISYKLRSFQKWIGVGKTINRSTTKVYDIFLTLTLLDEAKVLDNLPTFVSDDPDKMPFVKLTDIDMAAVMLKLSKMEKKNSTVKYVVDQNFVNSLQINCTNSHSTISLLVDKNQDHRPAPLPFLLI